MSLLNKVKRMIHPAINIENFINAGNAFGAVISVKNTWDPNNPSNRKI